MEQYGISELAKLFSLYAESIRKDGRMEQYGITELARLFGVSTETIRKYETKGLLESERNQDNQFRKYDMWDIAMLLQIRNFRSLDFSLREIESFLSKEPPELESIFAKRKAATADLILKYQKQFHVLEQMEESIRKLTTSGPSFRLEFNPALFYINPDFISPSENANPWDSVWERMQQTSFVSFYNIFDETQTSKYFGVAIEEHCLSQKGAEQLRDIFHYIPSRLCACMTLEVDYGSLPEEQIKAQLPLLEKAGYTAAGGSLLKPIYFNKPEKEYRYYCQVWIPIKKL